MDRAGRVAAYGAALALTPYLLIKVSWVVGSLLGVLPVGDGFGMAGWVVLNTVTIGMAAVGIALALALVRPWGMRLPGPPLAFCAWVGAGFLVSVLPFALLSPLLGTSRNGGTDSGGGTDGGGGSGGDDLAMPVWEGVLVQCGFVGMGLGLAVALPAYLRRRWPDPFTGHLGDSPAARAPGPARVPPWPAAVAGALGLAWLYWAAGGTAGLSHPGTADANWRALTGLSGLWAVAGCGAVWAVSRARPAALPRWVPVVLGWLGSGSLFAWSAWKLPLTLYVALADPADTVVPPEHPAVAGLLYAAAVLAGAALVRTLVRTTSRPRDVPRPAAPVPAAAREAASGGDGG